MKEHPHAKPRARYGAIQPEFFLGEAEGEGTE